MEMCLSSLQLVDELLQTAVMVDRTQTLSEPLPAVATAAASTPCAAAVAAPSATAASAEAEAGAGGSGSGESTNSSSGSSGDAGDIPGSHGGRGGSNSSTTTATTTTTTTTTIITVNDSAGPVPPAPPSSNLPPTSNEGAQHSILPPLFAQSCVAICATNGLEVTLHLATTAFSALKHHQGLISSQRPITVAQAAQTLINHHTSIVTSVMRLLASKGQGFTDWLAPVIGLQNLSPLVMRLISPASPIPDASLQAWGLQRLEHKVVMLTNIAVPLQLLQHASRSRSQGGGQPSMPAGNAFSSPTNGSAAASVSVAGGGSHLTTSSSDAGTVDIALQWQLASFILSHPEELWDLHCNSVDLQMLDEMGVKRPMVDVVFEGLLPTGIPQPSEILRQRKSSIIAGGARLPRSADEHSMLANLLFDAFGDRKLDFAKQEGVRDAWPLVNTFLSESIISCA
jgi:hypothetical protein